VRTARGAFKRRRPVPRVEAVLATGPACRVFGCGTCSPREPMHRRQIVTGVLLLSVQGSAVLTACGGSNGGGGPGTPGNPAPTGPSITGSRPRMTPSSSEATPS
jgi:hypothetical protein